MKTKAIVTPKTKGSANYQHKIFAQGSSRTEKQDLLCKPIFHFLGDGTKLPSALRAYDGLSYLA